MGSSLSSPPTLLGLRPLLITILASSLQLSRSALLVELSPAWSLPPSLVDGAHIVKAFHSLGPNLYKEDQNMYNSTTHQAPLEILQLDAAMCSQILAGVITSRTFYNTTVLVVQDSLTSVCAFSYFFSDPTFLYLALADAGATAIVAVTSYHVPGILSNQLSPLQAHRRATYRPTPFAAIGHQAGSDLQARCRENPDEPIHLVFDFDENRYQVRSDGSRGRSRGSRTLSRRRALSGEQTRDARCKNATRTTQKPTSGKSLRAANKRHSRAHHACSLSCAFWSDKRDKQRSLRAAPYTRFARAASKYRVLALLAAPPRLSFRGGRFGPVPAPD